MMHDAGDVVAGEQRPLDRRRAAPPRQQREVHVDHRQGGEHVRLDDPPVGDDDAELGTRRRATSSMSCGDRAARAPSPPPSPGSGDVALAAAPPAVGAGDDEDDLVAGGDERPQRRDGHLRRAEEGQAHVAPSAQAEAAARRRRRRRRLLQAAVLGQRLAALLGRHAVEHQHAVEVVELVLEHARLELVGLPLDRVAVEVDAAQQHLLRADHLDVQAGDRQAALLVDPLAVGLDDLRVEDDHRLVAEVPHEDLLLHADLRGGQGEAVVAAVERAEHLVDEAQRLAVDVGDGRGLRLQHGVAEGADLLGHACQATDGMPHYFDESPGVPSAEATVDVELPDTSFTLRTDRGVFSHGRLDAGTALLLRAAPPPPASGDAARPRLRRRGDRPRRSPGARRRRAVWAVDVNERARALCAANAAANGVANVDVVAPDDVPDDVRFDAIWSNPPIRIGKDALHELLLAWLDRLAPEGRAVLVVQKHLGADSLQRWLTEQGWPTTRLASAKGYRLLDVSPRDPD